MKSVVKIFILNIMMVAFCVFGTSAIFGQDLSKECNILYQRFLYPGCDKNCGKDKIEKGLATAKEYLEKCSNIKGNEEVKTYLIKQIPFIEKKIKEMQWNEEVIVPFNASVPAKDWDKTFGLGKQILLKSPDLILEVSLVLASIGYHNTIANPPIDKYNDDAITYAKIALQQMNEGKTSVSGNYGAFQYIYKTKECPDGKLNATGWMNYTIGYIMYYRQKQYKEAVPYLYQSTQTGCETKKFYKAYELIGSWYLEEVVRLNNSRLEKIKAAGDEETAETKSILALQRGYTERAVDAYARAYKRASQIHNFFILPLRNKTKELYSLIYDKDLTAFDLYMTNIINTPFADPAVPVTPKPKN